ncbi:CinA family protein [Dissulfurispira sp.]|uniref:CinA family protein n=1 Tax=Dissulfurispira sp. TaxID=2817609 RepID=UPI002FDAA558
MTNDEITEVIQKVHELLTKKKLTISVAESCTGGLISHFLTALPGSSAFFDAGIVTYSIESKKSILGVSSGTISNYGVVSEETAREMAEKVRILTRTDYSISATGNLGPDALEGKERGLIYIAVSREGQTFSRELRLTGDREANKEEAALQTLMFLVEMIGDDRKDI